MKDLQPLTISQSTTSAPTVLLTQDYERYLLYTPLNDYHLIGNNLLQFMLKHFKIHRLKTGVFSLKGQRYFCTEERDGINQLDTWHSFLWDQKKDFNQFLRPRALFEIMLFDLFFPLWGGASQKLILPGKKNQFAVHPLPPDKLQHIKFSPLSLGQIGLNTPAYKRFFSYIKKDLEEILEEFLVLHHDKFSTDVKYQISLYQGLRSSYWNEVKHCFTPSFKQFTTATVQNYIIQL